MSAANEPGLDTLQVGSIRMRVALQGEGPLVVFCLGFPELWCSWWIDPTHVGVVVDRPDPR